MITLIDHDEGSQAGWGAISQSLTAPAGATYLVVATASSPYGAVPTVTWNSVSVPVKHAYGGASGIFALANPAIGTYTLATTEVGDRGASWQALWLTGVNIANPVRATISSVNPGASYQATGFLPGDYFVACGYAYLEESAIGPSGTGWTTRASYNSGFEQSSCVGEAALPSASPYTLSLTNYSADDWHCGVVFGAAGGGNQVIWF
jgi:hypothetical protein